MIKLNIIFITIVFVMILLSSYSCNKSNDNTDIIDKYATITGSTSNINYEGIGKWYSKEESYNYIPDSDDNNFSLSGSGTYTVVGDRLYYKAKINNEQTLAYVSLRTGEKFFLCPDPLCEHTEEYGCKYLNLDKFIFSPTSDNLIYAVRNISNKESIIKINTSTDTITEIYSSVSSGNNNSNFYMPKFISDGKLYFTQTISYKEKTDNSSYVTKTEQTYMSLDLTSYAATQIDTKYADESNGYCRCSDGKYIYFTDLSMGRLFVTDMNFNNEKTILEYGDEYQISSFFYDTNTSNLYICVYSKYMNKLSDSGIEDGYIVCIDSHLNIHRYDMPSDKILDFQMTEKYIYYTVYDPLYYKMSPRGTICTENNGNKTYRALRDNTSESKLIFDGREELFFADYFVTGNYLYIDYLQFVDESGMNWFRVMGVTARIDLMNDTIKWLNLD